MKKLGMKLFTVITLATFATQGFAESPYVTFGPGMACTIHWGPGEGDCADGTIGMNSQMEPCCGFDGYPYSASGSHQYYCFNNDDYPIFANFFGALGIDGAQQKSIPVEDFMNHFSPTYNQLVQERFCR